MKVTNINRNGEIFDPKNYTVSAKKNPELYALIMKGTKNGNHD